MRPRHATCAWTLVLVAAGCTHASHPAEPGESSSAVDEPCSHPVSLAADDFHMQRCLDAARARAAANDTVDAWKDLAQLCDSPAVTVCVAGVRELAHTAPFDAVELLDEACYGNPLACQELARWYADAHDPAREGAALARVAAAESMLRSFRQALKDRGRSLDDWVQARTMAKLRIEHPEVTSGSATTEPIDVCERVRGYHCFWTAPHVDCPTFDTRGECEAATHASCQVERVERWACPER